VLPQVGKIAHEWLRHAHAKFGEWDFISPKSVVGRYWMQVSSCNRERTPQVMRCELLTYWTYPVIFGRRESPRMHMNTRKREEGAGIEPAVRFRIGNRTFLY
jgi:hypothetical protein